jgi:hypothetical protein
MFLSEIITQPRALSPSNPPPLPRRNGIRVAPKPHLLTSCLLFKYRQVPFFRISFIMSCKFNPKKFLSKYNEGTMYYEKKRLIELSINPRNHWCLERDSNPHEAQPQGILSPLRLPVPPSRLLPRDKFLPSVCQLTHYPYSEGIQRM